MLTEAEIQTMLERAEAATPGSWLAIEEPQRSELEKSWPREQLRVSSEIHEASRLDTPAGCIIGCFYDYSQTFGGVVSDKAEEDRAFIAAARQDVPALAREVLALRAERGKLRADLQWALDYLQIEGINQNLLAYLYARKLLAEGSNADRS